MANHSTREGSISGYFRNVFQEHPAWLHEKSNDVILARYRSDNGMAPDAPVDQKIKQNLANIKSVLRKEDRQKGKRGPGRPRLDHAAPTVGAPATALATHSRTGRAGLESLEEMIDDCLTMAKRQDRESLHEVIQLLRRARNNVVWKLGQ